MSREEEITRFVAFCIEQYKLRHGGDSEHVYDRLLEAGVLRFLCEHFDVEHCLDPDQIIDDVDQIVARASAEVVQ